MRQFLSALLSSSTKGNDSAATIFGSVCGVCTPGAPFCKRGDSASKGREDQLLRGERALNHPEAPAEAPSSQEKQPEFSV